MPAKQYNMANILLVMPSTNPKRTEPDINPAHIDCQSIPQSIIALAAYCERLGHNVRVLDMRLYPAEKAKKQLLTALPGVSVIGFSVMTAAVQEAMALTDAVKTFNPGIKTIWGGIHPTLFPEQTASDDNVDFVIIGEGELPLGQFLECLNNNESQYEDIDNLAFVKNGDFILKRQFRFMAPDDLPVPAYDKLDLEKYITKPFFNLKRQRSLEFQTSRGCLWRCAFCVNVVVEKRHWRPQSTDKAKENILNVVKRYKLDHITLLDEDFVANIKRTREIASFIKTLGVTWDANCRLSYFNDRQVNDETLKLFRESGCVLLRMGVESGSLRMRKLLKKDIGTNQDILRGIKQCSKYGIQVMTSFMVGLPTEQVGEVKETFKLVSDIHQIAPNVIHSGPQLFRPYPGGELYDMCVARGYSEPKNLREWSRANPGDFVAGYDTYKKFITNIQFVLDMIKAFSLVDKEYKRLHAHFAERIDDCHNWKGKLIKGMAEWRYRRKFWHLFYEYKLIRLVQYVKCLMFQGDRINVLTYYNGKNLQT